MDDTPILDGPWPDHIDPADVSFRKRSVTILRRMGYMPKMNHAANKPTAMATTPMAMWVSLSFDGVAVFCVGVASAANRLQVFS